MSSNKLIYDKCETNLRLSYNRNMLDWILYDKKYENDKKCHHKLGLVGGVEVSSKDVSELAAEMCSSLFSKTTAAQIPVDGGNDRVI